MRIAILTATARIVGGVEVYLSRIVPELHRRGHEIALVYEYEGPLTRPLIDADSSRGWCLSRAAAAVIDRLRGWAPTLLYTQGLEHPALEAHVIAATPAVGFLHAYRGACISGARTFSYPSAVPCGRRFGPGCLAYYFPRRCGGSSPVTMWQNYRRELHQRDNLRRHSLLLTASVHMRDEYIRHGCAPEKIRTLALPVGDRARLKNSPLRRNTDHNKSPSRLLYVGRLEELKGGTLLLAAMPLAIAALNRPLTLTFAGDGRRRRAWQARAAEMQIIEPRLRVEFVGWVDQARVASLMENHDLLVMPSLWPEPCGMVGLEAGLYGLPAVAFAVGGIPEWLHHGSNGRLAPANPPTAAGLADAIVQCVGNSDEYARLRRGAAAASPCDAPRHVQELLGLFAQVAGGVAAR